MYGNAPFFSRLEVLALDELSGILTCEAGCVLEDLDAIRSRSPDLHASLLRALAASVADAAALLATPAASSREIAISPGGSPSSKPPSAEQLLHKLSSMHWAERANGTPPEAFIRSMRIKAMTHANLALARSSKEEEEDDEGGGGAGGGEGDEASAPRNMLPSHVPPVEAARLLWSACTWMRDHMGLAELATLARALAVVHLAPGMPLMVANEPATFVAIALDGPLQVHPPPSVSTSAASFQTRILSPGCAVGYAALFQGGEREGSEASEGRSSEFMVSDNPFANNKRR